VDISGRCPTASDAICRVVLVEMGEPFCRVVMWVRGWFGTGNTKGYLLLFAG